MIDDLFFVEINYHNVIVSAGSRKKSLGAVTSDVHLELHQRGFLLRKKAAASSYLDKRLLAHE